MHSESLYCNITSDDICIRDVVNKELFEVCILHGLPVHACPYYLVVTQHALGVDISPYLGVVMNGYFVECIGTPIN